MKPFSQACANNQAPIAEVLGRVFPGPAAVFEIGAGTGQHAVYFARCFAHLSWHASDRRANHPGIRAWLKDGGPANAHGPLELDVGEPAHWETIRAAGPFDGVFSANTAHIMHWPEVEEMVAGAGRLLGAGGRFMLYGPFNRGGEFTSGSNRRFDASLRHQDPGMGVRNDADLVKLAEDAGFAFSEDVAMPANNRILIFQKT